MRNKQIGCLAVLGIAVVTSVLMKYASLNNAILLWIGCACIGYLLWVLRKSDELMRQKYILFITLFLISAFFWALSALSYSALMIFTEKNVNRDVWGWLVPAADFTGLNLLFIIAGGPVLTRFWLYLKAKGKEITVAQKFATGLVLMGFGFLVLVLGIKTAPSTGLTLSVWLVLSYFLQTLGELMIGPVGYAVVGKLAKTTNEGAMLGIWQMASGVGGALSYYLADYTATKPSASMQVSDQNFAMAFLIFALVALIFGVVLLRSNRYFNAAVQN